MRTCAEVLSGRAHSSASSSDRERLLRGRRGISLALCASAPATSACLIRRLFCVICISVPSAAARLAGPR